MGICIDYAFGIVQFIPHFREVDTAFFIFTNADYFPGMDRLCCENTSCVRTIMATPQSNIRILQSTECAALAYGRVFDRLLFDLQ